MPAKTGIQWPGDFLGPGACPGPDPGFAGVTTQEAFCEFIRVEVKQDLNLSLLTAIGTKS